MSTLSRRSVLAVLGAAAVPPMVVTGGRAAFGADVYGSNSQLYAERTLKEGVNYARRFRRHAALDDSDAPGGAYPDTAIFALHGGGIEPGTSELCVAIAGYDLEGGLTGGAVYDYWMFEGIQPSGNSELHVTAAHCDDPVADAMVGGSRRAVSVHGCTPAQADRPATSAAVLVGGRDTALKAAMIYQLRHAGFDAEDAARVPALSGVDPANLVNRTRREAGVQLELTTPLREQMFSTFTSRAGRKSSTTGLFWDFVEATRLALAS